MPRRRGGPSVTEHGGGVLAWPGWGGRALSQVCELGSLAMGVGVGWVLFLLQERFWQAENFPKAHGQELALGSVTPASDLGSGEGATGTGEGGRGGASRAQLPSQKGLQAESRADLRAPWREIPGSLMCTYPLTQVHMGTPQTAHRLAALPRAWSFLRGGGGSWA